MADGPFKMSFLVFPDATTERVLSEKALGGLELNFPDECTSSELMQVAANGTAALIDALYGEVFEDASPDKREEALTAIVDAYCAMLKDTVRNYENVGFYSGPLSGETIHA